MGQAPSEIRHEIEATRARMGETVDALGHKADVPARASEYVSEKKDVLVGEAKEKAGRIQQIVEENPLGLMLGGVGAGLLAGMLFPSTRVEQQHVPPTAAQAAEKAKELGREAVDRGKHVAEEAAQSAMETAKQSGQSEASELSSSLQEKAKETRSSTS